MNDIQPPAPPPPIQPATPPQPAPDPTPGSPSPRHSIGGVIWSIIGIIFNWFIVPIGIVLVLHFFVFQAFHVVGNSMVPTLNETDYLIISKVEASIARARGKGENDYLPKRGDIVVFRYPRDPNLVFVKRVIALPSERVIVRDGKISVINAENPDGFNPDESYKLSDPVTLGDVNQIIPDGHVFVVGDNRTPNGSFDSREWGPLPTDFIIGKAVLRLLPLDQMKVIDNPNY